MRYVCVFICFLLWLIFTLLLSSTVIGLVISVSDEWQEMGDKIIDKLLEIKTKIRQLGAMMNAYQCRFVVSSGQLFFCG